MDQNRWNRVKELLIAAEALPEAERTAWVADACGDDVSLQNEVLELLEDDTVGTSKLVLAPAQPRTGDLAGMRLGPWRLVRLLGSGGMGSVWLAERADDAFQMMAAAKLAKKTFTSPEALARFKRERQLLADLKHPNIATLYDGGTTPDGNPYFIMEYITGKTIDVWCFERHLSSTDILGLFRQLCLAVAYAHRKGVLHRDIKPANAMVNADGHVKLMDFGIASSDEEDLAKLTHGALSPMTPAYASPERLYGGAVTEKADIYALGLVLFHLLSRKRIGSLEGRPLQALSSWLEDRGDTHAEIGGLLNHMLARETLHRIGSVDAVIKELDQILGQYKDGGQDSLKYDAMIWHCPEQAETADLLARRLEDEQGLQIWLDRWHQEPSTHQGEARAEALAFCGALLVMVSSDHKPWEENASRNPLVTAQSRWRRRIVPLLLCDAVRPQRESVLPAFLRRLNWQTLQEPTRDTLETLARTIRGLAPERPVERVTTEACPFRGLDAFREEDARFFFGREALVQRLENHMQQHRFMAVLGPSGSGKSSVVQAGLIPTLRARGDAIVLLTPTANPLMELAYLLTRLLCSKDNPENLLRRMEERSEGLYFVLRDWSDEDSCLYLVVNQLEELFTLARDKEEVALFLDNLFYAIERSDIQFSVVVTLRSDFLGKCVQWPELASYCADHMILLEPMTEDELRRAMTEPAALAGLTWEKGLPKKILNDLRGSGSELPLLEHVLLELYERRRGPMLTATAYNEIGGIEGALARRAESIYEDLGESGQQIVRKMFTLCLVHPGEGAEDTRRRANRADLLALSENQDQAAEILDRFVTARLLTARIDEARSLEQVDVAHEALIRTWDRIKAWMDEDREIARQRGRLRRRAKAWADANRQDDHLLRGAPLLQMEALVNSHGNHLNQLEKDFVAAGLAVVARENKHREAVTLRLRKRKNQAIFASVVALILSVLAVFNWRNATTEAELAGIARDQAEKSRDLAQKKTMEANRHLASMFNEKASMNLAEDPQKALLYSLKALTLAKSNQYSSSLGRFADPSLYEADRLLWSSPKPYHLHNAAVSPCEPVLAMYDTEVMLMDYESGARIGHLKGSGELFQSLNFDYEGKRIAGGCLDTNIYIWQMKEDGSWDEQAEMVLRGHQSRVIEVFFLPMQRPMLASCTIEGTIKLWDLEQQSNIATFEPKQGEIWKMNIYPESNQLAFVTRKGFIGVWDAVTQKLVFETLDSDHGPRQVAFLDEHTLLTAGEDGFIHYYNLVEKKLEKTIAAHTDLIYFLCVDLFSKRMITSSRDNSIAIWDTQKGQDLARHCLKMKQRPYQILSMPYSSEMFVINPVGAQLRESITNQALATTTNLPSNAISVAYSPDGKILASGSGMGFVHLWSPQTGDLMHTLREHTGSVWGLAFSSDGKQLVSASEDHTVILYDLPQYHIARVFKGHKGKVYDVAFSPDGKILATASEDTSVRLWDRHNGEQIHLLEGHSREANRLAFSPDGTLLVSASDDATLILWEVTTGKIVRRFRGHEREIYGVSFSPSGTTIASASHDRTARLWNVSTGATIATLKGHKSYLENICFSPDGTRLATSSDIGDIRIWDGMGNFLYQLKGRSRTTGIVFSPDGKQLASASAEGTIKLWDVARSAPHAELDHNDYLMDIGFRSDNQQLYTVTQRPSQHTWALPSGVLKSSKKPANEKGRIRFVVSPNHKWLAFDGHQGPIEIEDLTEDGATKTLIGHQLRASPLLFNEKGTRLISLSWPEKILGIWDVETGTSITRQKLPENQLLRGTLFLSDQKSVAIALGRTIYRYDPSGQMKEPIKSDGGLITTLGLSHNGKWLASGSLDMAVRVRDLERGDTRFIFKNHNHIINECRFSPEDRYLATATKDRTLLWDLTSGKQLASMERATSPVFSPDGTLLSTVNDDSVQLWSVPDGQLVADLEEHGRDGRHSGHIGHAGHVAHASKFSPNGQYLASWNQYGTKVKIWHLDRLTEVHEMDKEVLFQKALKYFGYSFQGLLLQEELELIFQGVPNYFTKPNPEQHLYQVRDPSQPLLPYLMQSTP